MDRHESSRPVARHATMTYMLAPDHNPKDPTTWPTSAPECGWMVGVLEIQPILGGQQRTPHQWKRRGKLPKPDYPSVNGTEAWEVRTLLAWAEETGRLTPKMLDENGNLDVAATEAKAAHLAELFRNTFGREPRAHNRRGTWPTVKRAPMTKDPTAVASDTVPPPPPPSVVANGAGPVLVEPRLKGDTKKRTRSFRKPGVTA